MVFMMIRKWFSHTQSCRFTNLQNTRKSCFDFVGCTNPTILHHNFAGSSRSNWRFQFSYEHSWLFPWISYPPGSMKQIPRNFRALSRWSFSFDHFCLSFSLAFFPIVFQISGHTWSGLDVSCFLVNLHPDHTYPFGGYSSNRVNWVKPVQ